jgi:hypothetical protein
MNVSDDPWESFNQGDDDEGSDALSPNDSVRLALELARDLNRHAQRLAAVGMESVRLLEAATSLASRLLPPSKKP